MTKTTMVLHLNIVRDTTTEAGKEIYCRRQHKLCVPTMKDCLSCPYYHGMGGGDMLECEWEDEPSGFGHPIRRIYWQDRNQELMRVSKLIDDGVIKK